MSSLSAVHLCIVQPPGYLHSLGLLDPALYVQYQLRRLGVGVTLEKNRLREDRINVVFGAHLGFPAELLKRHACVFFNLEQLGPGGARLSQSYLDLLATEPVVDYDPENALALGARTPQTPVLPFLHAPYLQEEGGVALEDRPIDLLFFGSLNDRRREFIERVERCGVPVSIPDRPLYGPERDQLIRQAKAVLNCHFYDAARFERIRVQQCLSLGTPVISEGLPGKGVDARYEPCVTWLGEQEMEPFFKSVFRTSAFVERAGRQLQEWRRLDDLTAFECWVEQLGKLWADQSGRGPLPTWQPKAIHIGPGHQYVPGWLNLHQDARQMPDVTLDLCGAAEGPIAATTRSGGQILLGRDAIERIRISGELLGTERSGKLMTRALDLLCEGGELAWLDAAVHADADAARIEQFLAPWTHRFWESGAFHHRFELWNASRRVSSSMKELVLVKVATTMTERTAARAGLPDFGLAILPEVQVDPSLEGRSEKARLGREECLVSESASADPTPERSWGGDGFGMEDPTPVRVHVAYYRAEQREGLDSLESRLFKPWDVRFNLGSRLLEFDLFKVLLEKSPAHRKYWGVFSWKFLRKSGFEPQYVARQIDRGVRNGADVIVLNPAVASNALFRNVFEQGQTCGHAFMTTVAKATGLEKFVDTLMRHDTFAMSSYVVGTRGFWTEYVNFVEAYLEGAQELVDRSPTFDRIFLGSAGYWRDPSFDYRPFMVERLLQVFLHLRRPKVHYIEPDDALFERKFREGAGLIRELYRLKKASASGTKFLREWESARSQVLKDRQALFAIFHLDDPEMAIPGRSVAGEPMPVSQEAEVTP